MALGYGRRSRKSNLCKNRSISALFASSSLSKDYLLASGSAIHAILNLPEKLMNLAWKNRYKSRKYKGDKMSYKCFYCQKTLSKLDIEKRIICPYCSARVIMKTRPGTLKKVKAR